MASATEQMARQINWGAFGKAKDLKARLLFTLGALIIYRLGTHIPLPGVNARILEDLFANQSGGLLGMFDMFSGGSLQRAAIFSMSIIPYISASIIMQLASWGSGIPALAQLKKEGEQGRRKINQYTRYLTILLAVIQAYGVTRFVEGLAGPQGTAVINPGVIFQVTTVVTLVCGTFFLMWLGEQITARGIGNGISLIIYGGIVATIPPAIVQMLAQARVGAISIPVMLFVIILIVATVVFTVFMERAQRRLLVQYPKRQVGQKVYGGESSHLPLKLNPSGVLAPIFASSLMSLPLTIVAFSGNETEGFIARIAGHLQHGQPLYMLLYAALIVFFCIFATGLVFDPKETAENLRKMGGFLPGLKPGKNTENYLQYVLNRITVLGAAYITAICLLPEILINELNLPFYFGGTALLIVVTVPMDTVAQIHSHLIAHQYDALLRKRRVKGARRT